MTVQTEQPSHGRWRKRDQAENPNGDLAHRHIAKHFAWTVGTPRGRVVYQFAGTVCAIHYVLNAKWQPI